VSTMKTTLWDRRDPFLVVVPATTVIGALGATALGSVTAALLGAVSGLGWGLLLGFITTRLARRESSRPGLANVSVFLATLCSGMLAGGALLEMMLLSAGLGTSSTTFTMIHPPFGGSFNLFIITLNSLMEWLLIPVALFLNWHVPKRRKFIVMAAVVYYAMRVWTYIYFVPNIFEFGALPPEGPFSAELVERFRIWVNLSWFRLVIDVLTNLLFLLAAFVPASASGNLRKLAGEKAVAKEAQGA
jgi:hypothetical protein